MWNSSTSIKVLCNALLPVSQEDLWSPFPSQKVQGDRTKAQGISLPIEIGNGERQIQNCEAWHQWLCCQAYSMTHTMSVNSIIGMCKSSSCQKHKIEVYGPCRPGHEFNLLNQLYVCGLQVLIRRCQRFFVPSRRKRAQMSSVRHQNGLHPLPVWT